MGVGYHLSWVNNREADDNFKPYGPLQSSVVWLYRKRFTIKLPENFPDVQATPSVSLSLAKDLAVKIIMAYLLRATGL